MCRLCARAKDLLSMSGGLLLPEPPRCPHRTHLGKRRRFCCVCGSVRATSAPRGSQPQTAVRHYQLAHSIFVQRGARCRCIGRVASLRAKFVSGCSRELVFGAQKILRRSASDSICKNQHRIWSRRPYVGNAKSRLASRDTTGWHILSLFQCLGL